jgi:hypothetical protein
VLLKGIRLGAARLPEGIVCDTAISTSVPCSLRQDASLSLRWIRDPFAFLWLYASPLRTHLGLKSRFVFWDVLPCKIIIDRRSRSTCCLHHQGDDGGVSTYLWNVGRQLFYTAVHPRRQIRTSYSPPWELEISHTWRWSLEGFSLRRSWPTFQRCLLPPSSWRPVIALAVETVSIPKHRSTSTRLHHPIFQKTSCSLVCGFTIDTYIIYSFRCHSE